jgi:hypothetical protein
MSPFYDNEDGETFALQQNVDQYGQLQEFIAVAPLAMRCEKKGCGRFDGQDYKRRKLFGGWAKEPIFLCPAHANGRELA